MKIGLITTLDTNIGDDFIRLGICRILSSLFKDRDLQFLAINKHHPWTVYPRTHPMALCGLIHALPCRQWRLQRLLQSVASSVGHSRFDDCDMVVQCGAPVLWPGCHNTPWRLLLWDTVIRRISARIPILNLAAGACFPLEFTSDEFAGTPDANYATAIFDYCRLTTARDRLAHQLWASVKRNAPLLPCSAFLAADKPKGPGSDSGPVLINVMPQAGHPYAWNTPLSHDAWLNVIGAVIKALSQRHRVVMLCHDATEYETAQEVAPGMPRVWPKHAREYFELTAGAKAAICNRMHASVGLAGMGVPSVSVCGDSRLLMADALELPTFSPYTITADILEAAIEHEITERAKTYNRLIGRQQQVLEEYSAAIEPFFHPKSD